MEIVLSDYLFIYSSNRRFEQIDFSQLSTEYVRNKKPPAMRVEDKKLYKGITFPFIMKLFKLSLKERKGD